MQRGVARSGAFRFLSEEVSTCRSSSSGRGGSGIGSDGEEPRGLCCHREDSQTLPLPSQPLGNYPLRGNNRPFPFSPPPQEALQRAVRFSLHREVPRREGFAIGQKAGHTPTIGRQYAQCQLYIEQGEIAASAEDLLQQYQQHYGVWPYKGTASRDSYFLQDYPVACKAIDDLSRQVA